MRAQHFYQADGIDDEGYQENQSHNAHENILTCGCGRGFAHEKSGSVLKDEPDRGDQHQEQQKAHQDALGDMQADLIQAADIIDKRKQQKAEDHLGKAGVIAHGHGKHARHGKRQLDPYGDKKPLQALGR